MDFVTLGMLVVVSFLYSFLTQLIYLKLTDQVKLKGLTEKLKELQKTIKGLSAEEQLKVQDQIMKLSLQRMSVTNKAMLASTAMFFVSFGIFKKLFDGFVLLSWNTNLPIIGKEIGWFLTFVIISMVFNMVLRKKMGVEL